MARPTKHTTHRLPRWHGKRRRWRLTIDHHHGTKEHYFEGAEGDAPPPHVIAAAVAVQDQWAAIQRDWPRISFAMSIAQPDRDWTQPAWVTPEEIAAAERIVNERRENERRSMDRQTAIGAAFLGVEGLADVVAQLRDNPPGGPWRDEFALLLDQLRPAKRRAAVRRTTVEEAINAFIEDQRQRIGLVAGNGISPETFNAMRGDLLRAFGLTAGKTRARTRQTPIGPDDPMESIDEKRLTTFARYWQRLPAGVKSSRTVKNNFAAVRAFLKWAARQPFGFERVDDLQDILAAETTAREAAPFDPQQIRQVLSRGRARLKLYALLGLCLGYYPKDVATMRKSDLLHNDAGDTFIKRQRSKESGGSRRKRRGQRNLTIKHWIAPEIVALFRKFDTPNPHGLIIMNRYGLPMYRTKDDGRIRLSAAAKAWDRARERGKLKGAPSFAQLRKIGFNAIKRIAGSREVASIWAGHSGAIAEHYDDGTFEPVIEAQKKWAEELRQHGIL